MSPESGLPADGEEELLSVTRRRRWLPILALAVLVGAVVLVVVTRSASNPSAVPTHPVSSPPSVPVTTPSPTPTPAVTVTELGRPILDATGPEELFGRGPGVVVRIELARGRVTTTAVPSLNSSGPVSFVLTRHEAIVRPIDLVPAYEVPDEKPARQFSGPLSDVREGPIFPGPDGNSIWAESDTTNPPVLRLVRLDGGRSGSVLQLPRGVSSIAGIPDGAGYVAFTGTSGAYDSTPGGLRRVTPGSIIAVGPTRWLARTCDGQGHCPFSVVDPRSGASHQLASSIGNVDVAPGVISPDGTAAGVIVLSPSPALVYFDLRTGAETVLPLSLNSSIDPQQSLVWSLDSRWLFALDAAGEVNAVDARTRQITDFSAIGLALPSLTQLAIR